MNSLDIFLIPDIYNIINNYKKDIDIIHNLENDLRNQKIKFKVFNNCFGIIYVNISNDNIYMKIDNSVFTDIKGFNLYFYTLRENKKTLLYYIFLNELVNKFSLLDINYNYDSFKYMIFNFLFKDCKNLLRTKTYTIKKTLPYDFDYFYNKYDIKKKTMKFQRLSYNINVFFKNNNQKILNII